MAFVTRIALFGCDLSMKCYSSVILPSPCLNVVCSYRAYLGLTALRFWPFIRLSLCFFLLSSPLLRQARPLISFSPSCTGFLGSPNTHVDLKGLCVPASHICLDTVCCTICGLVTVWSGREGLSALKDYFRAVPRMVTETRFYLRMHGALCPLFSN